MRYQVSAFVTISISTYVEAGTEEEAIELAADRPMAAVNHGGAEDEDSVWLTSGEMDGDAFDLRIEK